jgi:hypothetical protein
VWGKAEGLVKDGVALDAVRGWMDELHDVMRSVERSNLDDEFKELP